MAWKSGTVLTQSRSQERLSSMDGSQKKRRGGLSNDHRMTSSRSLPASVGHKTKDATARGSLHGSAPPPPALADSPSIAGSIGSPGGRRRMFRTMKKQTTFEENHQFPCLDPSRKERHIVTYNSGHSNRGIFRSLPLIHKPHHHHQRGATTKSQTILEDEEEEHHTVDLSASRVASRGHPWGSGHHHRHHRSKNRQVLPSVTAAASDDDASTGTNAAERNIKEEKDDVQVHAEDDASDDGDEEKGLSSSFWLRSALVCLGVLLLCAQEYWGFLYGCVVLLSIRCSFILQKWFVFVANGESIHLLTHTLQQAGRYARDEMHKTATGGDSRRRAEATMLVTTAIKGYYAHSHVQNNREYQDRFGAQVGEYEESLGQTKRLRRQNRIREVRERIRSERNGRNNGT